MVEGSEADVDDAVRDGDRGEVGALMECVPTDIGGRVGDGEGAGIGTGALDQLGAGFVEQNAVNAGVVLVGRSDVDGCE